MITDIRLSQIENTYNGDENVLIFLINLLKESPIIPEGILLYKKPEWTINLQVYKPLPTFSYLIKAFKLAYPDIKEQSRIRLLGIVVPESFDRGLQALIESNKLKILLNKENTFIPSYSNNIVEEKKTPSPLSIFSQLVNNAEIG